MRLVRTAALLLVTLKSVWTFETKFALNFGKNAKDHTDVDGIAYEPYDKCKFPYKNKGNYPNVPDSDQHLYQTSCSPNSNNQFDIPDIPITGDGKYLLILKLITSFADSLNIVLNNEHAILTDYKIIPSKNAVLDELVTFTVCGDQLLYNDEWSPINNNSISVQISMKWNRIAGLVLLQGDIDEYEVGPRAKNFNRDEFMSQLSIECVANKTMRKSKRLIEMPTTTESIDEFAEMPIEKASEILFEARKVMEEAAAAAAATNRKLAAETVFALNFGKNSKTHTDIDGVTYKRFENCTFPYKHNGIHLNVPAQDQHLYQTTCFPNRNNMFNISSLPIAGDGTYLLILKFVTILADHLNILVNKEHLVLEGYKTKPSEHTVLDEVILFTVCDDQLLYKNQTSTIVNNSISVDLFMTWNRLAALVLLKGDFADYKPGPRARNFNQEEFSKQLQINCTDPNEVTTTTTTEMPTTTEVAEVAEEQGETSSIFETKFAINFGKNSKNHTDVNGIAYNLHDCQFPYKHNGVHPNVPAQDQHLYQTSCFPNNESRFDMPPLPIDGSGQYLLVLKLITSFADTLSVTLNKKHVVLNDFKVKSSDEATVMDELVLFSVCGDQLTYGNETSTIVDNSVPVEVAMQWNRIAALVLLKGDFTNYKVGLKARNFTRDAFKRQHLNCTEQPGEVKEIRVLGQKAPRKTTMETKFALNIGKNSKDHTDVNGISYKKHDGCKFRFKNLAIFDDIPKADQHLYQTSCTPNRNNMFDIPLLPIDGDGKYLLVLKLITNYEDNLSLVLNRKHRVLENYKIKATKAMVLEELILFTVCGNELFYRNETSRVVDNKISIDISMKYNRLAAIVLLEGAVEKYKVGKLAKNFDPVAFNRDLAFECSVPETEPPPTEEPITTTTQMAIKDTKPNDALGLLAGFLGDLRHLPNPNVPVIEPARASMLAHYIFNLSNSTFQIFYHSNQLPGQGQ